MSEDKEKVEVRFAGNTWEDADEMATQGGGEWIKFEPGQRIVLSVLCPPLSLWKTFPGADCEKRVWSFPVFVEHEDKLKYWDVTSKKLYQTLKRKIEARGVGSMWGVDRIGTGMDTTYDVEFERKLQKAELELAAMLLASVPQDEGDIPF